MQPGVFSAKKKDGSIYFRASFTFKGKHISLGSFSTEDDAAKAYKEALKLSTDSSLLAYDYNLSDYKLDYKKWITIVNFRDTGFYFKTPILLKEKYFEYYLECDNPLKFDVDDLFYYSTHSIMRRGGHYFVSDYGMQVNILSRYGIKNFAVPGKDYIFVNGDNTDFRHTNIEIINHYNGVTRCAKNGIIYYICKIHINGDYIVGKYKKETDAAIAYNKAVDILTKKGIKINYQKNYIDGFDSTQYNNVYSDVSVSKKIRDYNP